MPCLVDVSGVPIYKKNAEKEEEVQAAIRRTFRDGARSADSKADDSQEPSSHPLQLTQIVKLEPGTDSGGAC